LIKTIIAFILLTLAWPAGQLAIFWLRFGHISNQIQESWVFLPMGALGAMALLFFLQKATDRRQKISTSLGYLLAVPIALIGSLLSGLLLPPLVGAIIFGAGPLVIGAGLGYLAGRLGRPAH
jgi:hypothetical protein